MTKKTSKKTTVVTIVDSAAQIKELTARVEVLEADAEIVRKGFKFIANEIRPLYGMGHFGVVFDAIYDKLTK